MTRIHTLLGALAICCACSADGADRRLRVGTEGAGDDGHGGGGFGGSGPGRDGGVTGTWQALSVHVEDIDAMTIEVITLACAGDCAEVEAVASGGNPPYAFEWEDGSTRATRRVCLDADATVSVSATDTAVDADEFHYDAHSVTAELSARVLDCADGGDRDAGQGAGCLENPSFEGPVTPDQFSAFEAPPWNACYAGGFITYSAIADANLWPGQPWSFPDASDGATYLALGQQGGFVGTASQTLCEPLPAGETLFLRVDLAKGVSEAPSPEATGQVMQLLGGDSECSESTVLWTSPELTAAWTTHCVSITPSADITTLAFRPTATGGGEMEGLVDNLVFVDACP
jgi:hypothetical protein